MFFECIIEYIFQTQTKPLVSNIDELIDLKHIDVWIVNNLRSLKINRPREYRILKERSKSCENS